MNATRGYETMPWDGIWDFSRYTQSKPRRRVIGTVVDGRLVCPQCAEKKEVVSG